MGRILMGTCTLAACASTATPPPVVTVQPTLVDIQAKILTPKCAQGGCHTTKDAATAFDLALDSTTTSWQHLVGVVAQGQTGWQRVVAGQPEQSFLLWTLQKPADIVQRMPLGGPFLSAAEIDAVRQWIAAGAKPE